MSMPAHDHSADPSPLVPRGPEAMWRFPPAGAIRPLHGRSNFAVWRCAIQPVLLDHASSSRLILGDWTEPTATADEQDRRAWHTANTATCRFIRATLAMNVVPFVRQHHTAKALFFNLLWLYGDEAGIDTQGGPPAPAGSQLPALHRNRASLLAAMRDSHGLRHLCSPAPDLLPAYSTSPSGRLLNSDARSPMRPLPEKVVLSHPEAVTNVRGSASSRRRDSVALPSTCSIDPLRPSPDDSLETIHEEPHPGRRVSFAHPVGGEDRRSGSINSLSLPETSSVGDLVFPLSPPLAQDERDTD